MNLRVKIIIAKELKYLGIAIALAVLGFVLILVLGLYYEKREYPKYQKTKAEVEAEVAEWKEEKLKKKEELDAEKRWALSRLQTYIETNSYFAQDYKDYLLRWGFDSFWSTGTVSYARSVLKRGFYNNHIRKLALLFREYENCPVINSFEMHQEEQR